MVEGLRYIWCGEFAILAQCRAVEEYDRDGRAPWFDNVELCLHHFSLWVNQALRGFTIKSLFV